MQFPFIRCYNPNVPIPPHSFFILCKGDNAGRPSAAPWCNSFMVTCPHESYYEFYFWLCYGLSSAGKFKSYQRGTAIPFINIGDVRDLLRGVAPYFYENWQRYKSILSTLEKLEKYKATLSDQLRATKNLQDTLLQQYFNNIKEKGH